jgi:membrane protease YdiL (CAAX protease family)
LAQSQETPTEPQKKTRKVTPRLFLISDVEFVVIAIVLNYFVVHASIVDLFTKPWGIAAQLLFGIAAGAVISIAFASYLIRSRKLDTGMMASSFAQMATYPYWLLLTTGFIAGFAEELLFRGMVQAIAGIWITSILFMLGHAPYWGPSPHTVGKGIFAVLIFIGGVAAGYTVIAVGLTAVFAAHSIVDMSMFATIKRHFLSRHSVASSQATP